MTTLAEGQNLKRLSQIKSNNPVKNKIDSYLYWLAFRFAFLPRANNYVEGI